MQNCQWKLLRWSNKKSLITDWKHLVEWYFRTCLFLPKSGVKKGSIKKKNSNTRMQIHKNIILKMTKQNISNSSNQNNSTEMTCLKLNCFTLFYWSDWTISVEIYFSIGEYWLAKKCVFRSIFLHLFPYEPGYQPDYVLYNTAHNSLRAFTIEWWNLHGVQPKKKREGWLLHTGR